MLAQLIVTVAPLKSKTSKIKLFFVCFYRNAPTIIQHNLFNSITSKSQKEERVHKQPLPVDCSYQRMFRKWSITGLFRDSNRKKGPVIINSSGLERDAKVSQCERYWDWISISKWWKNVCDLRGFWPWTFPFCRGWCWWRMGCLIDSGSCAVTTGCKTRLKEQQARKANYLMVVVSHICSETLSACLFC